jgi:HlyD family secretion protein
MDMKVNAPSVDKQAPDGARETSNLAPVQLAPPDQKAPPAKAASPLPPPPPAQTGWSGKKALIAGLVVLAILAIGYGAVRFWEQPKTDPNRLLLYGNVDLRQVELAFNNSERVEEVLVQEGDRVTRGQVLARLDTSRLKAQAATAEAMMQGQQAVVGKLHAGSRPEEVAQAQANVVSAKADLVNADQTWRRLSSLGGLTSGRAISQQDLDGAKAALGVARARVTVAEKSLDLAAIGPRQEDIAQGEAQLRADQSQLDLLHLKLTDADLVSPTNAEVRSRLLEPGEMASPQRPIFNLAITDPKWIRAYVSETELGRVHPGTKAAISADGFPGRTFPGWIGFISPVAEFTPKPVQTEELRSSLVYEIRIFVRDPQDDMRLGMPATVSLELEPVDAQGQPQSKPQSKPQ